MTPALTFEGRPPGTEVTSVYATSATVWDQAYKAMGWTIDAAWADTDFAAYYHQQFQHDLTFVIRSGQVAYASVGGKRVSADALGRFPAEA